jgi:hypothetical protein
VSAVTGNWFHGTGAQALAKALESNRTLTYLSLAGAYSAALVALSFACDSFVCVRFRFDLMLMFQVTISADPSLT